jgi:hypothetical protein
MVEPEEILVSDPRGGLTPAQVVELKLLALLRTCNYGLFIQAAYTSQDMRRIPGKPLFVPKPVGTIFAPCASGVPNSREGRTP